MTPSWTIVWQLLGIALAAWGGVAILHIAALASAALLRAALLGAAPGTGGSAALAPVMAGTWAVLCVQLYRGFSERRSSRGGS